MPYSPLPAPKHVASRFWSLFIVLATFGLRVGLLDNKGLSYDEAASATMARASFDQIITFHWNAAFEHLPGWIVLLRGWSLAVGQSEFALRTIPAFASVLSVPLIWHILARFRPGEVRLRVLSSILVGLAPVLQLYGQEARMYSLVVTLALAAILAWFVMLRQPHWRPLVAFLFASWMMLSLQYYSALLLPALILCTLYVFVAERQWPAAVLKYQVAASGLMLFPLLLWMRFSPGFAETLTVVLQSAEESAVTSFDFLYETLVDLTFGAVRWTPDIATAGLLLLIPFAIGIATSSWEYQRVAGLRYPNATEHALFGMLAILCLVPLSITTLFFPTASTRYFLFVSPAMLILVAVGIDAIWRRRRILGVTAAVLVVLLCSSALAYYFVSYQKSEYRSMARYLTARMDPSQDSVMIEAPRQHLLARYYLPANTQLIPIPGIPLPDYWPLTAPPVVPHEIDDIVQKQLSTRTIIWTIYAGENEVDPGEFLSKYLTAVSYEEDCRQWLDVRLCSYISPAHVAGTPIGIDPDVSFGNELRLRSAQVTPFLRPADSKVVSLLVRLDWIADKEPSRNYKITLRLERDGQVLAQSDSLPIGRLLPPTTWNSGDSKPGYMVLPLPKSLAAGDYMLEVGMYDPETLIPIPYVKGQEESNSLLNLARIHIGDTIAVVSSTTEVAP